MDYDALLLAFSPEMTGHQETDEYLEKLQSMKSRYSV
jgi:hypothetical protein